jgi:hypothetical protein
MFTFRITARRRLSAINDIPQIRLDGATTTTWAIFLTKEVATYGPEKVEAHSRKDGVQASRI